MREPILMPALPGQFIMSVSDPVQDGRWNNMNEESLRAQERKLKLPVWKPNWRQATSTSACVQLQYTQTDCHWQTAQQIQQNNAKHQLVPWFTQKYYFFLILPSMALHHSLNTLTLANQIVIPLPGSVPLHQYLPHWLTADICSNSNNNSNRHQSYCTPYLKIEGALHSQPSYTPYDSVWTEVPSVESNALTLNGKHVFVCNLLGQPLTDFASLKFLCCWSIM